jgi:peptidoglycan/LPS O-acetylase OafA/YrhL
MKRNLQLDFLRFCGVFLVMINHMVIVGHSTLDRILLVIQVGGWTGVDLFFVLSGYLVSGLIMKEYKLHGSFNAARFLIRRGFKIYPTYYLYIIFIFIVRTYFVTANRQPTLSGLFHESVFVANYFSNNSLHLWSISVEEHFYFTLAILFLLLIKYKKVELNYFIFIYVFLLIAGVIFRLYNFLHYSDYDFSRDYTRSHFRFDSLFFGVFISFLVNYKREIIDKVLAYRYRFVCILFSIGFLSTNFIFDRWNYHSVSVVNLAINPICFGYLMLNVIDIKNVIFVKVISPLSYIGKYSYSIYLFHEFFAGVAIHTFKHGGVPYYLLYFTLAFTFGVLISKGIEYPLIGLREKYFPSRSTKIKPVFETGF